MIHLHSWDTSNGRKVFILLEERPFGATDFQSTLCS